MITTMISAATSASVENGPESFFGFMGVACA